MSLNGRGDVERKFDLTVGRSIEAARRACGWSAVALSAAVCIDFRRLYKIESGGRCSLFLAVEIAAALGVSLDKLIKIKDDSSFSRNPLKMRAVRRDCDLH